MIKRRLGDTPPDVPDLRVKQRRLPQSQVRTVKDGRVKVLGYWFRPRETFIPYDGRLEGQALEFGLYHGVRGIRPYISCFGCGLKEDDARFVHTEPDGQQWYVFDVWDVEGE